MPRYTAHSIAVALTLETQAYPWIASYCLAIAHEVLKSTPFNWYNNKIFRRASSTSNWTSSSKVSSCVFSSIQSRTWMYLLGYLMTFGTILAKMWRVYQIFHNSTPNKMVGNIIGNYMKLHALAVTCQGCRQGWGLGGLKPPKFLRFIPSNNIVVHCILRGEYPSNALNNIPLLQTCLDPWKGELSIICFYTWLWCLPAYAWGHEDVKNLSVLVVYIVI